MVTLLIALGADDVYNDIVVSCAYELIGTFGLYVTFEGHSRFLHIHGNNMFLVT